MARRSCWLPIALSVIFAWSCSSGSTSLLTPTPLGGRCAGSIDKKPTSVAAAGGTGTLIVRTDRECHWSVTGQPDWVTFTSPAAGQGPAEISYLVAANRSTSSRTVQLSVLGEQIAISQDAVACVFDVSPAELSAPAAGENARVRLTTADGCAWTARPLDRWIDLISREEGKGSAEILLRIGRNDGHNRRVGAIDIAGITVSVSQRAAPAVPEPAPAPPAPTPAPSQPAPGPSQPTPVPPPVAVPPVVPTPECTYAIDRDSVQLTREGQKFRLTLTTLPGCPVMVTAPAWWLEVNSFPKSGSGKVEIDVRKNGERQTRTGLVFVT